MSEGHPKHVAIIMDGNGRWAQEQGLARVEGHVEGVKRTREIIEKSVELGVETLTLFTFSTENRSRPEKEVSFLFEMFFNQLRQYLQTLKANKIRIQFLGDISIFPLKLRALIQQTEKLTRSNEGLKLNIAVNYGGRWDILQAVKKIISDVTEQGLDLSAIEEKVLSEKLSTAGLPDPDMFIRTGGDCRISNFLLWQLAYTELYFVDDYWPSFTGSTYAGLIESFANRIRRFGKTTEQVRAKVNA